MFVDIRSPRLIVPTMFVVYGLCLFGARIITLGYIDIYGDGLLALLTCAGAILMWVVDIC